MALSPMYAAILQDLNKAVATHQPEDVLQFCANWFNAKLEEQRIAGRLSIAQAEAANGGNGVSIQQRSKSLAPGMGSGSANYPLSATSPSMQQQQQQQQHPMKKKVSLPSLVGQGYTFGSSPSTAAQGLDGQSPFSEIPPLSRSGAAGGGSRGAPPSSGGINWQRSFGAGAGPSPMPTDAGESDEDSGGSTRGESRDKLGALPSGMTSPLHQSFGPSTSSSGGSSSGPPSASNNGIPTGYNLGRRTSVSAESIDPNSLSTSSHPLPKTVIPKSANQRSRIEQSIEKNLLFRNLDEEQHTDVLNAMKEVKVTRGTEVIVQGAVGDFFYVVESGEFQVWVKPAPSSGMIMSPTNGGGGDGRGRSVSAEPESAGGIVKREEDISPSSSSAAAAESYRSEGGKLVATINAGGSFGELALMYNAPRAATVVCHSSSATLWALDRVTFRTILMEHTSKKRRMYEKFLSEVPILVSLEAHERSKIADALEERIYEEGEDVVREGELGKNFYIIESGRAEVLKRKSGDRQERVGTLSKGDYFGELALLNSAPRAATVRPVPGSGRLRVATLGEKAFTRLLGPVVEILTRRAERNYGSSSSSTGGGIISPSRTHFDERERGTGPRESASAGNGAGQGQGVTPTRSALKTRSSRDRIVMDEGSAGRRERKRSEDVVMDG